MGRGHEAATHPIGHRLPLLPIKNDPPRTSLKLRLSHANVYLVNEPFPASEWTAPGTELLKKLCAGEAPPTLDPPML